jgi:hypothetical protein
LINIKPRADLIGHRLRMLDRQNETTGLDAEDDAALSGKVSFLSRTDSYSPAPETVTARETHMSWVFMAGDRVYKLKWKVAGALARNRPFTTSVRTRVMNWSGCRQN